MGASCCCCSYYSTTNAELDNDDDDDSSPSLLYRINCVSLSFLLQHFFSRSISLFRGIEARSISSIQGDSRTGNMQLDSSFNDAHHTLPRPLPYDIDQRHPRLQRDGLVSRRDKSMTNFQEDSQTLRRNGSTSGMESLSSTNKWNGVDSAEALKLSHSESLDKVLSTKVSQGLLYVQSFSEDEDVCPTCLDDYTPENPKITMKCSHHFHLGCIYEWMERSDNCPICGKEMVFCESP